MKILNIYIVDKISKDFDISSYPTLENCLFSTVKLTKHTDINQYKYSRYGIGFDRKGSFSLGNGIDRNVRKNFTQPTLLKITRNFVKLAL